MKSTYWSWNCANYLFFFAFWSFTSWNKPTETLCLVSSFLAVVTWDQSVVRRNIKLHGCVEKGKMSFISVHVAPLVKTLFPGASTNCT